MHTHSSIAAAMALLAALLFAHSAHAFDASSPDTPARKTIDNKFVYKGFGCSGDNISPAINWKNAPKDTKSFAVLVHDGDAPTGGAGFWHWLVVDIPASANGLAQGVGTADGAKLPAGARQINTDFGTPGWGGPCPPPTNRTHRYNFTVYALKVDKLDLPTNATASLAGFMVNGNAIAKTKFTAVYKRSQ
jgi:Raf kinase inhibitor-like YbhB/YbcL family protein